MITFLHIAPLLFIILLSITKYTPILNTKMPSVTKWFDLLLLLSSTVGIVAGSGVHAHDICERMIIDPCFGYAATILWVAIRIALNVRKTDTSSFSVRNSKNQIDIN